MLDWNYKRIARANKLPIDKHHGASLQNFPIERARLDILWPVLYPGLLAILGYGWALEASTPLAGPLVLLFLIGLCLTAAINSLSTLLVDMYPQSPATVTAGNNIVRCGLGAGATAVVDLMIGKMGKGWCLTFVVGVCLLFSPILMVEGRYGMRWREERRMRIAVEGAKKGEGE